MPSRYYFPIWHDVIETVQDNIVRKACSGSNMENTSQRYQERDACTNSSNAFLKIFGQCIPHKESVLPLYILCTVLLLSQLFSSIRKHTKCILQGCKENLEGKISPNRSKLLMSILKYLLDHCPAENRDFKILLYLCFFILFPTKST